MGHGNGFGDRLGPACVSNTKDGGGLNIAGTSIIHGSGSSGSPHGEVVKEEKRRFPLRCAALHGCWMGAGGSRPIGALTGHGTAESCKCKCKCRLRRTGRRSRSIANRAFGVASHQLMRQMPSIVFISSQSVYGVLGSCMQSVSQSVYSKQDMTACIY